MRTILALASLAVIGTIGASALAQNLDVIKQRKDLLSAFGKSVKQPSQAFKGEDAFDLAKVQAALKTIQENSAKLPALFPDDAKTGGDTEALPKIWENKADFESRMKKLNEAATALQTSITDEETFQAQWKDFMGNCSGCHKEYRKPKS